MNTDSATVKRNFPQRAKRALFGAAASTGLFVLARIVATLLTPLGSFPYVNLLVFLGTPFLLASFIFPGASALGVVGATAINALFWLVLGAILGALIRKPLVAAAVWLVVAGALIALAFAGLVVGMMSSGP